MVHWLRLAIRATICLMFVWAAMEGHYRSRQASRYITGLILPNVRGPKVQNVVKWHFHFIHFATAWAVSALLLTVMHVFTTSWILVPFDVVWALMFPIGRMITIGKVNFLLSLPDEYWKGKKFTGKLRVNDYSYTAVNPFK